jgi:hypothetical protein
MELWEVPLVLVVREVQAPLHIAEVMVLPVQPKQGVVVVRVQVVRQTVVMPLVRPVVLGPMVEMVELVVLETWRAQLEVFRAVLVVVVVGQTQVFLLVLLVQQGTLRLNIPTTNRCLPEWAPSIKRQALLFSLRLELTLV